MTSLVALLESIPDVVWSGLLASGIALAGVLVANRSNTTRLRAQFAHEAELKGKERLSTLRRDVYLQAAEETAKANAFLASLPQADPTESNLGKGLQGFFAAAAKVQLVAEPKTSLLVMQQVGRYGEIFIGLLARAQPLHDARTEINVNDSLYSTAQAEIARVLADMTKLRESAKPDLEIAAALRQTFEFQQAQAATFSERRAAAWEKFNRANTAYVRMLFTDLRSLADGQVQLQVEIRRDLGLTTDLPAFEHEMEAQRTKMLTKLDQFLSDLGDA